MTVVAVDVLAEPTDGVDEQLVRQLVDRVRGEGVTLTGDGGLLARLTMVVVESALEGEMDDHLGYGKHDPVVRRLDGGQIELASHAHGGCALTVDATLLANLLGKWLG